MLYSESKKIHGDKYDYSKVEYTNSKTKVCIICPKHGEFWQIPSSHLAGKGCLKCAQEYSGSLRRFSQEDFINKSREKHGDKYDYSKVVYVNNITKVCIICPKHGEFWQTPAMHTSEKQGCPICGQSASRGEDEIREFIQNDLKIQAKSRDRGTIYPQELDILLEDYNLAIEYNGLRWHSELMGVGKDYHIKKLEKCLSKGVRLIQVFEDEYVHHKDIVLSKIKHILHKDYDLPKIYARKCQLKELTHQEAKEFLNKNHIQGYAQTTLNIGAFFNGQLVGIMSFKKINNNSNDWEINRFATDNNYRCIGIGGKIWKYFIRNFNPQYVKSFADRRWTIDSNCNLYTELGFELEEVLKPDYRYYNDKKSYCQRIHKFNCRKHFLSKKYDLDSNLTEKEMCEAIGLYRIWDCGLFKYSWRKGNVILKSQK